MFTKVDGKYYSFPINLNVLSELFNTKIYNKEHALALINPTHFEKPANFEEAALNAVGEVIYKKFVKNYTENNGKHHVKIYQLKYLSVLILDLIIMMDILKISFKECQNMVIQI